jgi:hypothetical protein
MSAGFSAMSPKSARGTPPLEERFRFQVQVTNACPELLNDLQRIPARARPERLRALAMLGITLLRGGVGTGALPTPAPSEQPTEARLQQQRLRLLSALGGDAD